MDLRALTKTDLLRARIPEKFREASFSNTPAGEDRDMLIKYLRTLGEMKKIGYGIALSGQSGIGKTTVMCAMLKALMQMGQSVLFISAYELRGIVLGDDPPSDGDPWPTFDEVLNCGFLLIDDFGAEYSSVRQFTEFLFAEVFTHRFQKHKPVLLTTNISLTDVDKRYGHAVSSRFSESMCYKRVSDWPVYRQGESLRRRKLLLGGD